VLVFLDFDGVLRRLQSPPDRFDPDCRESFEAVVRERTEIRIVIASSWRLATPLDNLRKLFSTDVGERVIGATPEATRLTGFYRHQEVQEFLLQTGRPQARWLAVDDHRGHYPAEAEVVVTDANQGFGQRDAEQMRTAIARLKAR